MENSISINTAPEKIRRSFLPEQLNPENWEEMEVYFKELTNRSVNTLEDLKKWLLDSSELDAVVQEHIAWLYIRMTCNTQDESLSKAYTYFVEEIQPKMEPYDDALNKKLVALPMVAQLSPPYQQYLKQVKNAIKIFREENIPLHATMTVQEQKYGEMAGAMSINLDGNKLTMQQAANHLKNPDRSHREKVYRKMVARRKQDRDRLDELFNTLIKLRNQVAGNAGFENYRDYAFVEMDRFDYTAKDCEEFHASVQKTTVPLLDELLKDRKKEMNLDTLKPWDLDVDTLGRPDMKPFRNGDELMDKTIACFDEIHPYFGEVTRTLKTMKHIDLDSRIGKAPGGYNYPLYESGVPFIFMNASGSLRDITTMVHEGGHAIHSMLTRDIEFIGFKEVPSEIAELASMSMELISMEHWHHFFENPEDLRRAKREQLEGVIETLPWIACIDAFQHWLYTHPSHSEEERTAQWKAIFSSFSSSLVDWSEDQEALEIMWQKQLHLFEVPFYYIEYGMAQLGAIAVWRNYKQNPSKAVDQYIAALQLGYTRSIPEVYATAGVKFDFSTAYMQELMNFVRDELAKV